MDAMGAYGSDESDNDVLPKAGESQETDDKKSKKTSGLAGLLGDYSDDDDDDDGAKHEIQGLQPVKQGTAKAVSSDETSRKRQRRWDSPKNTSASDEAIPSASVSHPFPPPLTSDGRFMIEWNEDYVTAKQSLRTASLKKVTSEKLQHISAETSWAQQLKKQHDFHNPHFFESVVEQFGIRDEMGSNLPNEEQFAGWEFDLAKYEEQARVQEQAQYQEQNTAASSHFAQQQLERAMQQP
jgi:hypothetical protein